MYEQDEVEMIARSVELRKLFLFRIFRQLLTHHRSGFGRCFGPFGLKSGFYQADTVDDIIR